MGRRRRPAAVKNPSHGELGTELGGSELGGSERASNSEQIRRFTPLNRYPGKLGAGGGELGIGREFQGPIPQTSKRWNSGFQFQKANSEANSVQPNTALELSESSNDYFQKIEICIFMFL